jgi:hypothetical protein
MAKQNNRPDTPLASTPPTGEIVSMKGAAMKSMEERRAKVSAEKALKEAKEKQTNDYMKSSKISEAIKSDPQYFGSANTD